MKKTLIALAVAGVAVTAAPVAMADAGAYGSIRTAVVLEDDDDDSMAVTSGASRFGFKGTEDLGNGMMGVYRYEFAVDSAQTAIGASNRLSYVGVKGGFGEVTIGRHWAPFYEHVVGRTDTFQAIGGSAPIVAGAVTSADGANDTRGPSIRTGNTLKYSNAFGGIKVGVMAQMRDNGADDDDIDRLDISVSGQAGAIGWGAGLVSDSESQGDDTTFGVGLDFAVNDDLKIVGAVATMDNDAFDPEASFSIGAIMQLGGGMQVQVRFSDVEDTESQVDLGFEKKFSKRTRVFAELDSSDPEGGDSTSTIALGVRHDF